MNVRVDLDITPEEIRRLMGLPDVQDFNKEVMAHMLKKLQEGVDGYDPVNFFRSSIVNNTEVMKNWMDMFTKFSTTKSSSSTSK